MSEKPPHEVAMEAAIQILSEIPVGDLNGAQRNQAWLLHEKFRQALLPHYEPGTLAECRATGCQAVLWKGQLSTAEDRLIASRQALWDCLVAAGGDVSGVKSPENWSSKTTLEEQAVQEVGQLADDCRAAEQEVTTLEAQVAELQTKGPEDD